MGWAGRGCRAAACLLGEVWCKAVVHIEVEEGPCRVHRSTAPALVQLATNPLLDLLPITPIRSDCSYAFYGWVT